jgi:small-conductance mechanosensitive channel
MKMNQTSYSAGDLLNPESLVGPIFLGALVLALTFVVAMLIRRGTRRVERHLTDVTALGFISSFAQLLTYLFGFVLYAHLIPELRALGAALLTGVSVISVVIGVAAQGTLSNLVAGFSLVLYRTIHVGDTIRLDSPVGMISARVHIISLAYTVLIDDDKHEIVVPNNVIMNSAITRVTQMTEHKSA